MQNLIKTSKSLLLAIGIIAVASSSAHADIDKKYFAKMADKIWSMDLPGFDANANLSDSIFQGQSAVYIARYIGVDADYDNDPDPNKQIALRISNRNATDALVIRRSMVKINDPSAAEYFTEFTINPGSDYTIDVHTQNTQGEFFSSSKTTHTFDRYTIYSTKEAFGARIHKQDGSVSDVDLSQVLTQTAGKNEKDVKYKIAIPGLKPGDILEYFFTTEYFFDELSIPEIPIPFLASYPTRLLTIDIAVDPKINMEYGAYNGAPRITQFAKTDNGKNLFYLQLENLPSLDEKLPYFSVARQMPLMEVHILNNNARIGYVPKMARPGGMRIANPAFVLRDIGFSIVDAKPANKIFNDANSLLKNWIKQNPEATPAETADAAWTALRYATTTTSKENINERQFVKMFHNLLYKFDSFTDARIGVANSRKKIEITEIAYFDDASYFVKIGDRFYMQPANPLVLGGQIPSDFDGENYALYTARPDNPSLYQSLSYGRLPKTKPNENTLNIESLLEINPLIPDSVHVNTRLTLTGVPKKIAGDLLTTETFMRDIETYLGAKPKKLSGDIDIKAELNDARESMEKLSQDFWDSKESRLINFSLVQSGVVPTKPETIVEASGMVPDAITQAGNNLMVNIGKFIGRQQEITGSKRSRDISIIKDAPSRTDISILLKIPDGYEIVEESLADLNQSVNTKVATFNTDAKINDDNTVRIRVIERYLHSVLPAEYWDEMLKIIDAAHDFTNASILLRPKK